VVLLSENTAQLRNLAKKLEESYLFIGLQHNKPIMFVPAFGRHRTPSGAA
jgi:hypothetical protein